MSSTDIDFDFVQTHRLKRYSVFFCNLVLHTSITLVINLFDGIGNQIHSIQKQIEGEEYELWGLDDSYLEKIVDIELDKIKFPVEVLPVLEEVAVDIIVE